MKTKILLLFAVLVLFGCKEKLLAPAVLKQSILLFKDKDGIYRYDSESKKEHCLYKAKPDEVFLNDRFELRNDTLTFGIRGPLSKTVVGETYVPYYYSVALKTGDFWLSGRRIYNVQSKKINVKTETISRDGKITVADSVLPHLSSDYSYKNVVFNDSKPRFYSQHIQGDHSVYSENGNIYYTKNGDTTLLVKFNGRFDPKFGSGYYQPQLDPTGTFVIFRYLPGLMKKEMPSFCIRYRGTFRNGVESEKRKIITILS